MITPAQSRAARNLLVPMWTQRDLAKAADVSLSTVRRFEAGSFGNVHHTTVKWLERAFVKAGIVFTNDDEQIGVTYSRA